MPTKKSRAMGGIAGGGGQLGGFDLIESAKKIRGDSGLNQGANPIKKRGVLGGSKSKIFRAFEKKREWSAASDVSSTAA